MKGWHLFSPLYADGVEGYGRQDARQVGWRCKNGCGQTWPELPPLDQRTGCRVSLNASTLSEGTAEAPDAFNRAAVPMTVPPTVASVLAFRRPDATVARLSP